VHHDALARAIHHALENGSTGNFTVNGRQNLTFKQIFEVLCQQQGADPASVKHTHELFGFADVWNEFWSGVSHDTNMRKMVDHFSTHDGLHENDYFTKHGLSHEEPTLKEVFARAPST
jgi:nucleoside-diphosphate-sugar epimerase